MAFGFWNPPRKATLCISNKFLFSGITHLFLPVNIYISRKLTFLSCSLHSLLQTVPSDVLDKGKAVADAYRTPDEDSEAEILDPELKRLESILWHIIWSFFYPFLFVSPQVLETKEQWDPKLRNFVPIISLLSSNNRSNVYYHYVPTEFRFYSFYSLVYLLWTVTHENIKVATRFYETKVQGSN